MNALPVGSVVGIVGGGQLGRMLGLEAKRLGLRIAVMDPDPACPAAAIADHQVTAPLDDPAGIESLARLSAVLTFETEHVPAAALAAGERLVPVRPAPAQLARLQDRLTQRQLIAGLGLPQTAFAPVHDDASLAAAAQQFGSAAIVKTRRGGYDGLGQARVDGETTLAAAWTKLGRAPSVVEAVVPFVRELSVIVARDTQGELREYPIAENVHRRGILHTTRVPAAISSASAAQARDIGRTLAQALAHVGVLTVELFELASGDLLVNEIAPRVHNSGHFTWGAAVTSQFEQHLRAITGAPLGDPRPLCPVVMLNLLGELWAAGEPDWAQVSEDGVRLHHYAKRVARPGRKMGHLLVFGDSAEHALARAERLHDRLTALAAAPDVTAA